MSRYLKLVFWFIGFLVCVAVPPLLIAYVIAIVIAVKGRVNQVKYEKHQQELRNRDVPTRGY